MRAPLDRILDDNLELPVVPAAAARYCKRAGLRPDQVRWCEWCGIIAPAIDHHQRSMLDAVGFTFGLCPDCKFPSV